MKKVINEIKAVYPQIEEQEIKRAYWREAKRERIGPNASLQIRSYLEANNLTTKKSN